jgi:Uma2 family endonuclease
MAMRSRVQLLAEDIWDTPDDGNRYEVIDGELYMTPPPSLAHQHAVSRLLIALGAFVSEHGLGHVYVAPLGVVLERSSGVQPDLVFVSAARVEIMSDRGIEGAPDLAVEVLSPSTESRDRGIKMRRYAAAGVQHYWIIDPRRKTLEAFRLEAEGYVPVSSLTNDAIFEAELFPGLIIRLADLWR